MAKAQFDCSCGNAHSITPLAMNQLLAEIYGGTLQTVTAQGVQTPCAVRHLQDQRQTPDPSRI